MQFFINYDRVMRWRLFIALHIRDNNIVADALGRLPKHSTSFEDFQEAFYAVTEHHENISKDTPKYDYHTLSYAHLKVEQQCNTLLTT
jgi:hypothetical protein